MKCIQAYNVSGWRVIESAGEAVMTYLTADVNVVIRLRAMLMTKSYEEVVRRNLEMMRQGTQVVCSASGEFYVNGLVCKSV